MSSTASSPASTRRFPNAPRGSSYTTCIYCEPDKLGTAERWREWDRKRHDPRLQRWFADPDGAPDDDPSDGGRAGWPSNCRSTRSLATSSTFLPRPTTPTGRRRPGAHHHRSRRQPVRRGGRRRRQDDPARRAGPRRSCATGVPITSIAAITFTEKAAADLRHRLRRKLAAAEARTEHRHRAPDRSRPRRPRPRPDRHAARLRPPAAVRVPHRGRPAARVHGARRARERPRVPRAMGRSARPAARRPRPAGRARSTAAASSCNCASSTVSGSSAASGASPRTSRPTGTSSTSGSTATPPPRFELDTEPSSRWPPSSWHACDAPDGRHASPKRWPQLAELIALRSTPAQLPSAPASMRSCTSRDGPLPTRRQVRATRPSGRGTAGPRRSHALACRAKRPWRRRATRSIRQVEADRQRLLGALVGAFVLDGAGARAVRRHARVPRPARCSPGGCSPPEPTSVPCCTGATNGSCSTSSRTPIRSSSRSRCGSRLAPTTRRTTPTGEQLRPLPERLFIVGDPKQSIYRFRRADIAQYLRAAEQTGADTEFLSANFRSSAAVIDWVNHVFDRLDRRARASPARVPRARGVPTSSPRTTARSTCSVPTRTTSSMPRHGDAEELRSCEAAAAADAVVTALVDGLAGRGREATESCGRAGRATSPSCSRPAHRCRRSRRRSTSADRPYRAENSSVVYTTAEIRHLMLALRAADDPTDQLALVAALRSPLYGCSDVELYEWVDGRREVEHLGALRPRRSPTHPVAEAIAHVRSVAERISWRTPADLLAADRRRTPRARRRARQPRCPRRLAARPLRDRPGPGVGRRRRARGAALPVVGADAGVRGSHRRHHPSRARPRRRAHHDGPRRQGPRVPDHHRVGAHHQAAARRSSTGVVWPGSHVDARRPRR